ncbi:MAG: D-aminoacyl-tRNA deacylase [Chloroflexota bacterium]
MRALLQRVQRAAVTVDDDTVGQIGLGWVIFVGVTAADTDEIAVKLAERAANLRCFSDDQGKMNRSALDAHAEMLVISQFTLYAETARGRRPSFVQAAPPGHAKVLVNRFTERLRELGLDVKTGRFGAHMLVDILNDGPVTMMLDSEDRR